MSKHSIAEAKDRLPELIERALGGEDVVITREGEPIVELRAITKSKKSRPVTREDLDWIAAHRVGQKVSKEDAGTFVSRMRDEEWR